MSVEERKSRHFYKIFVTNRICTSLEKNYTNTNSLNDNLEYFNLNLIE